MDSAFEESPAHARKQLKECNGKEPLGLIPTKGASHCRLTPPFIPKEFHIEGGTKISTNVEHQFIPSVAGISILQQNNNQEISESKGLPASSRCEDISISLQLGGPGQKRRKHSDSLLIIRDRN